MNKLKSCKELKKSMISCSQGEPNHNGYVESCSPNSKINWQFSVQNAEPIRAAVNPSSNEAPRQYMHSLTLGEHGPYTEYVWYQHHNAEKNTFEE